MLRHTSPEVEVLVIDDASSEGDFAKYVREAGTEGRVEIRRNEKNLGFVLSCNLGMKLARKRDVILLNSDTEVTSYWVEKLQSAAYSRDNIGTVTPFTNNGVIASVPRFCQDNELPMELDAFAKLIERVSKRSYLNLPTCVGFCTYIRRTLLDQIGFFDEESFGLGNGEENDLSMRASKAGFDNVLDDATFIYHKGNCSFQEKKAALCELNMQRLLNKHPDYMLRVDEFCRTNPLQEMHESIHAEMIREWEKAHPRSILHVLHNGPFDPLFHDIGGTELHVQDLIQNSNAAHWSLVPGGGALRVTAHMPRFNKTYLLPASPQTYNQLLAQESFDLVHIHHTRGLDYGSLVSALEVGADYIVSLHDFHMVCPRINLLTIDNRHCNGQECVKSCKYEQSYIDGHRQATKRLLKGARKVFAFSESTKNYMTKILSEEYEFSIERHGIWINGSTSKPESPARKELRVAFVGFIPKHKGSEIIAEAVRTQILADGRPIEWHVVGELFAKAPAYVKQHGKYDRRSMGSILQRVDPDVVAILTICPETYCLTLDEAWSAGIPVIVSDLGAQAERMNSYGAGWILKDLTKDGLLALLDQISSDPRELQSKREALSKVVLRSVRVEAEQYEKCYAQLVPRKRTVLGANVDLLGRLSAPGAVFESYKRRFAKKCLNQTVRSLERLKLRQPIQRLALNLLPGRVVERLKALRQI